MAKRGRPPRAPWRESRRSAPGGALLGLRGALRRGSQPAQRTGLGRELKGFRGERRGVGGAVLEKREFENRTVERPGGLRGGLTLVRPTSPGAGLESRSSAEKAPAPASPSVPRGRPRTQSGARGRRGGGRGRGGGRRRRLRRATGGEGGALAALRLGHGAGRAAGGRARPANGHPAGRLTGARHPAAHLGTWALASPSQSNAFICIPSPALSPQPGARSQRTQRRPPVGGGSIPCCPSRQPSITFSVRLWTFQSP